VLSLVIGLVIGLVLGLTGAGGSVFAVPLLLIFASLPMSEASGIALGAVAASALYGSVSNIRHRRVLWLPALLLGAGGVLGAPAGQYLAAAVPELWLQISFLALALMIAVRMYRQAQRNPQQAAVVRAGAFTDTDAGAALCRFSPSGRLQLRPPCIASLGASGLIVGVLSGVFGVGGGFLIVPLLLGLSQLTMRQAVATSLVIIAAISSAGFMGYWHRSAALDWPLLGLIALGGVLGMVAGQHISRHINNAMAQKIFAVALVGVSLASLL
jgi:uncharacterized membrane protein YfcA